MKESSRIWNELVMAKHYALSIAKYTSRQRKTNRIIDLIVVIMSLITIPLYMCKSWIPIIGVIISISWKYANKIVPLFKQDKDELIELDALHTFYESYYNRLEHLWYLHNNKRLDDDVLMSLFFREKEAEANKKTQLNRLQKEIDASDSSETQQEAIEYLNQVFKSEENDE